MTHRQVRNYINDDRNWIVVWQKDLSNMTAYLNIYLPSYRFWQVYRFDERLFYIEDAGNRRLVRKGKLIRFIKEKLDEQGARA